MLSRESSNWTRKSLKCPHSDGKPIVNLVQLKEGDKVAAILPVRQFEEGKFVFLATRQDLLANLESVSQTPFPECKLSLNGGLEKSATPILNASS